MSANRIWVLTDERPGNQSQAKGVAQALGEPFDIVQIEYDWAVGLPNLVRGQSLLGLSEAARARFAEPWPLLAISAGRRIAPAMRWLKRTTGARLVQIMDPGWPGRADFDLIAIPEHDEARNEPNVLHTAGAPYRPLPDMTEEERARVAHMIGDLPRPWLVVFVGGNNKNYPFGPDLAHELMRDSKVLAEKLGASLLVLTSKRSGAAVADALEADMPPRSYLYKWRPGGDNPFLQVLTMADAIVATGDSMSMCSEACANGGPVYIFAPERLVSDKYRLLHQKLYDGGYARPLGGDATPWRHPPLDAAIAVADEIRKRGLL